MRPVRGFERIKVTQNALLDLLLVSFDLVRSEVPAAAVERGAGMCSAQTTHTFCTTSFIPRCLAERIASRNGISMNWRGKKATSKCVHVPDHHLAACTTSNAFALRMAVEDGWLPLANAVEFNS